jgi:glutaminyl-peptide cyclotransferase
LACSSKNSSRKPISFISFDTKKESIVIGDELSIQIRTKSFNNDFKNTIIYLDDSIIATSNIESFDFKLDTKYLLPGKKIIKSKAICSNNKVGFYNLEFLLLSDIVPSERSYEIIEILPHSPTFFTQGLEFHNNILYEGTGQYGSSGIYAYYPGKNKIIKSVRIEDQYFGEGITI